ncbi:MAG: hypothetical protein RL456_2079 [Pseudomonadota bacterium]|jgi:DNA-binding LytR/AlgR family response regulator
MTDTLPPATALIAEDEPLLAAHLKAELLRQWPSLRIVAMAGHGREALEQALRWHPDLCFLDIRMPGLGGLEVARAMAEAWPSAPGAPDFPLLVFVTAYDQHAVEAFEAQATDYLLKPLRPERLRQCLERIGRQLGRRSRADSLETMVRRLHALIAPPEPSGTEPAPQGPRLALIPAAGAGGVVEMVPVEQVIYFEAADKYVRVVTAGREHLVRTALKDLATQLDPDRFWQVHRGVVVQARCIAQAVRDEQGRTHLLLHGRPERLAVSRLHAHLFRGL